MRREVRPGRRQAADDGGARSAQGGHDCRLGAGHGEERTKKMEPMFVTLEVSKLSGWLNSRAVCQEPEGGIQCGARFGSGGRGGEQRRCKQRAGEGSTANWGQGTGRSALRTCTACS